MASVEKCFGFYYTLHAPTALVSIDLVSICAVDGALIVIGGRYAFDIPLLAGLCSVGADSIRLPLS